MVESAFAMGAGSASLIELAQGVPFEERHIGPSEADRAKMLAVLGYGSLEDLAEAAIPATIRLAERLNLPPARSEAAVTQELRDLAGRNRVLRSMIGLGYYGTFTPAVIRRNVLESPAWYTAYTPYQPEISQGRLEALLNFQTMVADLVALPVSGASLLDEATAAAEAMTLSLRATRSSSRRFLVDADAFPQTLAVLQTRAEPLGIELVPVDLSAGPLPAGLVDYFGLLVQYPGASGAVRDLGAVVEQAHAAGALVTVAADLLALTLLKAPGDFGADIAVGTTQRFGVPMGFGGPHAGYLAVREGLARSLPGRLVGVSQDAHGHRALRLALQTREQHIRREKATSNICTAQVLLAVVAGMYAVYHGPEGLSAIARRVHRHAVVLAAGLRQAGFDVADGAFFDTLAVRLPGRASELWHAARAAGVNVRLADPDTVTLSCDETTTWADLQAVWQAFGVEGATAHALDESAGDALPAELARASAFLTHPVFHAHRSETAMLRYLRRLSDRDVALDRSMIPLGSCTMKLNATTEMEPITWPEFADIHPFAPLEQAGGYLALIGQLERWLAEVTGYDRVSVQPNAGSQGEFAGLMAVRAYHRANGQARRDVCLIPSSAHGTNAASAVMAGMRVVVVGCRANGDVDVDDLREKIAKHREQLAVLMVTYPSTHGVFEEQITDVCAAVHEAGGQVYVDGANLNALVGLAKPGRFGADVSHLNLHKTFCIPHGGGGPGVGPVAVRAHLAPYLPNHPLHPIAGPAPQRGHSEAVTALSTGPVSAAPWGSAGILPIPWAYIRLMGGDGLRRATQAAVLAANYVASRLGAHYPVLYTGPGNLVAHECILDLRGLTKQTGVTVEDVAKRLIDYGFHAPTMSFPVAGTLMVEPTESEDLAELDRFCAAMTAIRGEIEKVGAGEWDREDNPLRNAPHTAASLVGEWAHGYDRATAVFPEGPAQAADKYWPPVARVDGAFGDRNLVCSCPPVEELAR